jgi:pimeloyl-ACP methyl ester carboxylesterase
VTTFVLVHGAWHGAWCWRRVARLLARDGHEVFTPTLTGLGERSHLLAPGIDLDTHILDVANEIKWQELKDVVLVGHSYGGMVISGVAERVGKAIAAFVMLDAFFPENGEALIDLSAGAVQEAFLAAQRSGATSLPPRSAAAFKVNENDRAWVDAQCTPQPIGCVLQKLALTVSPSTPISAPPVIRTSRSTAGSPRRAPKAGARTKCRAATTSCSISRSGSPRSCARSRRMQP